MKLSRAKHILHQHAVTEKKIEEAKKTLDLAWTELEQKEVGPTTINRLLMNYSDELKTLREQIDELKAKEDRLQTLFKQRTEELKQQPPGLRAAQETLRQAQARLLKVEKELAGWSEELNAAKALVDDVKKREEEFEALVQAEKEKINPEFAKEKKLSIDELARRQVKDALGRETPNERARRKGKRFNPGAVDTMGNETLERRPLTT